MQKFIPFVDTLIENINKPSKPNNINIILDGGGFNGSYHHGVLIYFNQLEKKHYVKINKISGCSIGAVFGMLYLLDLLDDGFVGYDTMRKAFKNSGNISFAKKWLKSFNKKLDEKSYLKCNNRLFITYYDISECKQIVVSKYKSNGHLLKCVLKSIFIPFAHDGQLAYKNKYVDGFTPYIFENNNADNIFVNLQSLERIKGMFNVYYDKNCYSRILNGIDNAHLYYIKKRNNSLCSCVNNWSYEEKFIFI